MAGEDERSALFVLGVWDVGGVARVTAVLANALAGRGLGGRLVSVLHNIPDNNGRIAAARGPKRWLWARLSGLSLRLTYRRSDAFVVLSKRFEHIFRRVTGLRDAPKLRTIGNPLTLACAPAAKENAVLCVGRLKETQERVARVLDVWRRLLLRAFGAHIGQSLIYRSVRVYAPWNLRVGNLSCIGPGVDLYCKAPIALGDNTVVSQGAYLCTATHDLASPVMALKTAPIVIGCWVAARAAILPGVTLGDGAVAGLGAVVTRPAPRRRRRQPRPTKIRTIQETP